MRRAGTCLALLTAALVAGCAIPAAAPPASDAEIAERIARRDAAARALDTFRVRAGLGVIDGESSGTARVDWRQSGETLDVGLAAPLGLGRARLIRRDGVARLERGDAPPLVGRSGDEILRRALGLSAPVPLDQLGAWLRGLPGDARDVRRDAAGRLESLVWRDAGGTRWQARVLDWTALDGLELPALVTARGGGYRLRLALRDWSRDIEPDTFAPSPGADRDGRLAPADAPRRLPIPTR